MGDIGSGPVGARDRIRYRDREARVSPSLRHLHRESRRLFNEKWGLVLVVGICNLLSVWRMNQLDQDERAAIGPAWLVLAIASAAALTIAVRAGRQLRHVQEQIRVLTRARRQARKSAPE
jgi:uncharacterized membrane protein